MSEAKHEVAPCDLGDSKGGRDGKGRFLPGMLPVVGRPIVPGERRNPKGRPYNLKLALEKALQRVVDETGQDRRLVADTLAERIIDLARGAVKDSDTVAAFKVIAQTTVPKEIEHGVTPRREPGVVTHTESAHEVRKREREEKA